MLPCALERVELGSTRRRLGTGLGLKNNYTHRQDWDALESDMRGCLVVVVEHDGLGSDYFHKVFDGRELCLVCHRRGTGSISVAVLIRDHH